MFSQLPIELLQYIFMLLSPCTDFPNVLLVCKRWHTACKDVIKLRKDKCFSAFKLESPLKWTVPKAVCGVSPSHSVPSKRFGSTVIFHQSLVYVFGGATSMFTTFNDLWVYDLYIKSWKRLPGEGELPTPRAHAKGGFIENVLYLFGGCQSLHHPSRDHSGQINWLSDLNRFDTKRLCWSRVPLKHDDHDYGFISHPPVNGGQSGCFLPASSDGDPCLLVLFGGISQVSGACVNDVCFVAPTEGRWRMMDTGGVDVLSWPSGRCGHAVCALNSFQMLVLFGNRESPTASDPAERSDNRFAESDESKPYQGQPAADVWILTRCKLAKGSDWRCTTWFWTKVHCPINVTGCPPIDFYHSVVIRLPYTDKNKSVLNADDDMSCISFDPSLSSRNSNLPVTFTVLCVSQSTEYLLEEAARQRRNWRQRCKSSSSHGQRSLSRSPSNTTEPNDAVSDDMPNGLKGEPSESMVDEHVGSGSPSSFASTSTHCLDPSTITDSRSSSLPGRRSVDRRAKRLEALAAQERRLFGSRLNTPSDRLHRSLSGSGNALGSDELATVKNPLAVYSLRLQILPVPDSGIVQGEFTKSAVGRWLPPKKLDYIDLINGPHDCLGFSCTFGPGCLFLFGGLCGSDEPVDGDHVIQNASVGEGPWRSSNESIDSSLKHSLRVAPRPAAFYVLQPKGLVGTVV